MFWPFTVWGFPKPIFKPHEYWLCKACCCNSTYRLRYWNVVVNFNSMWNVLFSCNSTYRLRYWNSSIILAIISSFLSVATVLTVYGIETILGLQAKYSLFTVATVLTVYGIETVSKTFGSNRKVCHRCNSTYRLRYWNTKSYYCHDHNN